MSFMIALASMWQQAMKTKKVITIGESWTWGNTLGDNGHDRLTNAYGYHLAQMLDADWENIAVCGESNAWIAHQYQAVATAEYDYDEVFIVCTLTEVGREINNPSQDDRDYVECFKNCQTLVDVQNETSNWIGSILATDTKHKALFGCNFADSNYKNIPVLEKTWIDLIAEKTGIYNPSNCYTMSSWVFDKLEQSYEFMNTDRTIWVDSILEHIEIANQRVDFLIESPFKYNSSTNHPTPGGHKIWADYLYSELTK